MRTIKFKKKSLFYSILKNLIKIAIKREKKTIKIDSYKFFQFTFRNQKLKCFEISSVKCHFRQTLQLQRELFQLLMAFLKQSKYLADL